MADKDDDFCKFMRVLILGLIIMSTISGCKCIR
jgi:hypothetical protein